MQFLSEDFVSEWGSTERPALGNRSGLVVIKVDGGPDGKVSLTLELAEGLIVDAYIGSVRGRDLELTMPYELAVGLFLCKADPAAEYMKGHLKMSGDMELWFELLPAGRNRTVNHGQADLVTKTVF